MSKELSRADWRKAKDSGVNKGNCLEVVPLSGECDIRDSETPTNLSSSRQSYRPRANLSLSSTFTQENSNSESL